MDETRLRELLSEIGELDATIKRVYAQDDKTMQVTAPATEESLSLLRKHMPCPLPSSYEALLRISDGIANFKWISQPLLSIDERLSWNPESMCDLEDIWFFIADDDFGDGTVFDLATISDSGEPEVVELAGYQEDVRWPSLDAFLQGYRDRLKEWIANEVADRAALEDD